MDAIVAIPSTLPGGMDAPFGAHFGHCDLYTVVKVEQGEVSEINLLPNAPHQAGGCMAPVQLLAQSGVQILVAGGMGMRPLMGFSQMGIRVFHDGQSQTVGQALSSLLQGQLIQFSQDQVCGGGGECHSH
jgi:predicted Fe-Mo cluster-binding NifX family protein